MTIFKEPLFHFLLLGALIFLMDGWFESQEKEQIIITPDLRDYLVKSREQLQLRSLTELEVKQVLDTYIREEMLYREAYKRGLDKRDTRMRQNLVRKMYGLVQAELPQPTEAQLRSFFDEHPELFLTPATMTLEQVFFQDSGQVPGDLALRLNKRLDFTTQGDVMLNFGRNIPDVTLQIIAREFGTITAQAIAAIDHYEWFGPVESRHGTHFFRIVRHDPPVQWQYEEVAGELEQIWFQTRSEELLSNELKQIAEGYEVVYRESAAD